LDIQLLKPEAGEEGYQLVETLERALATALQA